MILKNLPKAIQKKIQALTDDEEFQKRFSEDKELDQFDEEFTLAREAYIATFNKREQRMCQLVVDYLFEKKKIKGLDLIFPKWKEVCKESLIRKMKEDPEKIRYEDDDE